MYYTYVLHCFDSGRKRERLYVGSCENIDSRMSQHKIGNVKTTKSFDKINLVYFEACRSKTDALRRENQLKTGFGRGYLKRRLANDRKMRD